MANIKVDEYDYHAFLNAVDAYIESNEKNTKQDEENLSFIKLYISKEKEIRRLILDRDHWFEYYLQAKKISEDKEFVNTLYKNYAIAKEKLKEARES